MKSCEEYELEISMLMDGELPAEDLLPAVDHLAECPSCRAFYREARSLTADLPAALPADRFLAAEPAPPEVWKRIEAAGLDVPRPISWRTWVPRLAAALILVAGSAWAAVSIARPVPATPNGPMQVVLGEDGDRMTERRFVEITTEILRAGPRYHREMLEVMSTITDQTRRQEAPPDTDSLLSDERSSEDDSTGTSRREREAT